MRWDDDMYSCTCPKLHLYAAMISCLCALLLEVTRSNMASLSLPEEHKATFFNNLHLSHRNWCLTASVSRLLCEILCVITPPTSGGDERRPFLLNGQKSWRREALTDAFHSIVKVLGISAGIKVRRICYCASEHL